jgi:hypothetical protein
MLERDDLRDHPAERAVFAHAGHLLQELGAAPDSYRHLRSLARQMP